MFTRTVTFTATPAKRFKNASVQIHTKVCTLAEEHAITGEMCEEIISEMKLDTNIEYDINFEIK